MIIQNQRGFSMTEIMIAIAIISIIALITLPAIKQWTHIYKETNELAEIQRKHFLLFTEINRLLNTQSPLTTYAIHTEKLTASALPNYMSASVKNNPQKTNSHALSIQIPNIERISNAENQIISSNTFFIRTCLLKTHFTELKKQNVWLLVSVDGIIETEGELTETGEQCENTNNKTTLYQLAAKRIEKPIFTWNTKQLTQNIETHSPNIKFILPIKESATLYVDTKNILRRIDHNQGSSSPVNYDSYSFAIEILSENSNHKILNIQSFADNESETKFKNLITKQVSVIPNDSDKYLDIFF